MKKLEIYGVQEMDIQEMKKTDGGWGRLVWFVVGELAWELVRDGVNQCIADFKEGYNSTQ